MTLLWFLTGPLAYLAVSLFVVAAAWKIVRLARLPRHLRWELYPLARLGPEGSKYQQVDFARSHEHGSHLREAAFMAEEILLLKKIFQHRRGLWLGSWLMHLGLYLGAGFLALLAVGGLWDPGTAPRGLGIITTAAGGAALILGTVGCVLLLQRRLTDPGLRAVSDRPTYLNLGLLVAIFASGLVAWLAADFHFRSAQTYLASLLRLRPGELPLLLALPVLLLEVFLIYLPLSRMFHFAAKYFTYHWILWENEALRPGSGLERAVTSYLELRPDWSAGHMRPGGTWAVQADPAEARTPERKDP